MKKDFVGWGCFGIAMYTLVVMVVSTIASGFVLRQLWSWFVTPMFGISALTVPQAMGLNLVSSLFLADTKKTSPEWDGTTEAVIGTTFGLVLRWGLFLLIGWIIQSFI